MPTLTLKKLETCLNACLDSIDWTAAKAAFEVTLFGLLTTVYSGQSGSC